MAKCARCGRSGLSLKLDAFSFCTDCQIAVKKATDVQIAQLESEIETLRKFRSEYIVIPDARSEAQRILDDAQRNAESILSNARLESEEIVNQANEYKRKTEFNMNQKLADANNKLERTKSDARLAISYAEQQIAGLLSLASKEFSHQAVFSASMAYKKLNKEQSLIQTPAFVRYTPSDFRKSIKNGYVAFDFETTGLSSKDDKIIEIGAIKYDSTLCAVDRYRTFVDPGMSIPSSASAINGIDDSMVHGSPKISDVLPSFYEFIGNLPLIAHNADFDIAFLKKATYDCQCDAPTFVYYADTLEMSRKQFTLNSYKLSSVAEHIGISCSNAHRAIGDCEMVGGIVKYLLDKTSK